MYPNHQTTNNRCSDACKNLEGPLGGQFKNEKNEDQNAPSRGFYRGLDISHGVVDGAFDAFESCLCGVL